MDKELDLEITKTKMKRLKPPKSRLRRLWSKYRHIIYLLSAIVGLLLFLEMLPLTMRATLYAGLRAQQALLRLLFFFSLIVLSLVWSAGQRLDTAIFSLLNIRGYRPKWLDNLMWITTQLGNFVTAALLTAIFYSLNNHRLAIEIILGTFTLWILVETIKALADRTRPFLTIVGARVIGWRERGLSFPSGHTAQTFFLVTLINRQFDLGTSGSLALYAIALLVGITRMYVGAHYPRDVIGGAILGTMWAVLLTQVDPYWYGLNYTF
jgi:membrane-associated phospholipid phosphatase